MEASLAALNIGPLLPQTSMKATVNYPFVVSIILSSHLRLLTLRALRIYCIYVPTPDISL